MQPDNACKRHVTLAAALFLLQQVLVGAGTPVGQRFCDLGNATGSLKQPAAPTSLLASGSRTRQGYNPHAGHHSSEIALDSDDGMYACHIICVKYSPEEDASFTCAHKCHEIGMANIPTGSPDCQPVVQCEKSIKLEFEDLDFNHDEKIDEPEAQLYGRLMCIPWNHVHTLFMTVDSAPQDGDVTRAEWDAAGEDSAYTTVVDDVADKVTRSAVDETQGTTMEEEAHRMIAEIAADHEVQAPPFESLDKNGDGGIQDWELFGAFMGEITKRHPGISYELRQYITGKFWAAIDDIFPRLDTNHDMVITPDEYEAANNKNDMGDELGETQQELDTKEEAAGDEPTAGLNTEDDEADESGGGRNKDDSEEEEDLFLQKVQEDQEDQEDEAGGTSFLQARSRALRLRPRRAA